MPPRSSFTKDAVTGTALGYGNEYDTTGSEDMYETMIAGYTGQPGPQTVFTFDARVI